MALPEQLSSWTTALGIDGMWRHILSRIFCCCIRHTADAELSRNAVSTLTLEIVIVDEELDNPMVSAAELNRVATWPNLMVL